MAGTRRLPFLPDVRTCAFCRGGGDAVRAVRRLSRHGGGRGYAEYLVVQRGTCVPFRRRVVLDAAIAADAIATPLHACREEARIGPGDRVLVVGAGGGVASRGAGREAVRRRVLGADVTDEKLEMVRSAGATRRSTRARRAVQAGAGAHRRAGVEAASTWWRRRKRWKLRPLARPAGRSSSSQPPQGRLRQGPDLPRRPGLMLRKMLEIHGSRYVTLSELAGPWSCSARSASGHRVPHLPPRGAETAHQLLRDNKFPVAPRRPRSGLETLLVSVASEQLVAHPVGHRRRYL